MDYFLKNMNFQKKELKNFLINIFKYKSFKVQQFKKYNAKREYYPRLQTEINSFIDWSWHGQEIEIFCNSFSSILAILFAFFAFFSHIPVSRFEVS